MHNTPQNTTDQILTYFSNLSNLEEWLNMVKEICGLRQTQAVGSTLQIDDECENIPDNMTDKHDYHRASVQRFIKK